MGEYIDTYLRLGKKTFEEVMGRANQESIDSDLSDEDAKNELLFSTAEIRPDEFYVEDKKDFLHIQGELHCFGKELGWIDMDIPLDQNIAIQIIERYLKKLGKLKTVLEATKD